METTNTSLRHALMVEDESFFRDYFSRVFATLGSAWHLHFANSGVEAGHFFKSFDQSLDLILVDLGLPDMDGLDVIKQAYQLFDKTPIIVMTMFSNEEHFISAIRAGASGYLLKSEPESMLTTGLQQVLEGHYPVSPMMARYLFRMSGSPVFKGQQVALNLSSREVELLSHLSMGISYAMCAEKMCISLSTVQSHVRNIYRKLNVSNQTQAINKARASGHIT